MSIKKGYLMNKDKKVALVKYDSDTYDLFSVEKIIDKSLFPINIINEIENELKLELLQDWFFERSIPANRQFLDSVIKKLGILHKNILTEACFGLSLTDQYWINPTNIFGKPLLKWEEINFFTNTFTEDVGNMFFTDKIPENIDLKDPINTSDGWLAKKWTIINGERYLVKGGSGKFIQEPINEIFATKVLEKINCVPYVEYSLNYINNTNKPISICKNICDENTELIPLAQLLTAGEIKLLPMPFHFQATLNENARTFNLDINEINRYLDILLIVDFIIMNEDRHVNNIFFTRKQEDLTTLKLSKVLDNGSSMLYKLDKINEEILSNHKFEISNFRGCSTFEDYLKYVKDFNHFDLNLLNDIDKIAYEIYTNAGLPNDRVSILCDLVKNRLEIVKEYSKNRDYINQPNYRPFKCSSTINEIIKSKSTYISKQSNKDDLTESR